MSEPANENDDDDDDDDDDEHHHKTLQLTVGGFDEDDVKETAIV